MVCRGSAESLHSVELVSVGVVALNEQDFLPGLFEDFLAQDFDRARTEIVLVDSGSSDESRALMESFAARASDEGYGDIKVIDNPRRIQAAGWNEFIRASEGNVLIRLDAHASIAPDFISRSVAAIEAGEDIVGGSRPTTVPEALKTPWRATLHIAEEAAFGSSVSPYRGEGKPGYVPSVFHGCYRREVFRRVGMFDERLLRTEDNDLHYRIRKAGYKILLDPAIRSSQFVRSSFKGMLKQKYGNGFWVGRTVYEQPGCLQPFHFAPFVFVLGIIALFITGVLVIWTPLVLCTVLYGFTCVALAVRAAVQSPERNLTMAVLPLVFLGIHLSYGVGTLAGLVAGLFKKLPPFDTRYNAA